MDGTAKNGKHQRNERTFYQITLQLHMGDTQLAVQHRDFTVVDTRTSVTVPHLHQRTLILEFRRVASSCLGRWYRGKCTRQWIQHVSRRLCKVGMVLEYSVRIQKEHS